MLVRTLEFNCSDPGRIVELLLTFQQPQAPEGLYQDLLPVSWKVIHFNKGGISTATIKYTGDTGFFVPQSTSGNIVYPAQAAHCKVGQRCIVTNDGGISTEPGNPEVMECVNETDAPIDIGAGLFRDEFKIDPIFAWKDVGVHNTVVFEFTPILDIYSGIGFKEEELIRGPIETPLLYQVNLLDLPHFSSYTVSVDSTGEIKIERDN